MKSNLVLQTTALILMDVSDQSRLGDVFFFVSKAVLDVVSPLVGARLRRVALDDLKWAGP